MRVMPAICDFHERCVLEIIKECDEVLDLHRKLARYFLQRTGTSNAPEYVLPFENEGGTTRRKICDIEKIAKARWTKTTRVRRSVLNSFVE